MTPITDPSHSAVAKLLKLRCSYSSAVMIYLKNQHKRIIERGKTVRTIGKWGAQSMGEVRLLIADGNSETRKRIAEMAENDGYTADVAADGIAALKLFRRHEYAIFVLEGTLPELDGWHVCSQIRKASDAPILVLSERAGEEDKLSFFRIGADDYIAKPFSLRELSARIKVFLRRTQNSPIIRRITFDGLCIDTISRTVYVDGNAVPLTPREYNLLLFLASNPHRAFSREAILNEVWGEDYVGTDRTVDTHIKSLREGIKPYQDFISTIWSYGYMFKV